MVIEMILFDVIEYFGDLESQVEFINDVFESGDLYYIVYVFGIIVCVCGMIQFFRDLGMIREVFYKVLSKDGDLCLSMLISVFSVFGVKVWVDLIFFFI